MSSRKLVCLECAQANRVPVDRLAGSPKCGTCGASLMPSKPVSVDFTTLVKAARIDEVPLLVDFWAPWCGPCRMMAPEYDRTATALKGRARLVKIDTQMYPQAGVRWNIQGIPAFLLFRAGKEIGRQAGTRLARDLVRFVQSAETT
jgi:thioredoxin 2